MYPNVVAKVIRFDGPEQKEFRLHIMIKDLEIVAFDITPRSPEFIDDLIDLKETEYINDEVMVSPSGDLVRFEIGYRHISKPPVIMIPLRVYKTAILELKTLLLVE